ncbi:hypothetical protein IPM19_03060 [bacterium]|nr:MAG: hypothetical protein IPM19_03060 [bacterium]
MAQIIAAVLAVNFFNLQTLPSDLLPIGRKRQTLLHRAAKACTVSAETVDHFESATFGDNTKGVTHFVENQRLTDVDCRLFR